MYSTARVLSTINIENKGVPQGTAKRINFLGNAISASASNSRGTISVPAASGSIGEGYALKNIVRYTSPGSGTYVKPDDVDALLITAVGGGAGGGSNSKLWNQFASVSTTGANGTAIAADSNGNIFWAISNHYNGTTYNLTSYVYKVDSQGNVSTFASASTSGATWTDLTFDSSGNLYWAVNNHYNGTTYNLTSYVYKITPQGDMTTFASVSTEGAQGVSLAWDTSGNLYWAIANRTNGSNFNRTHYVYKITPEGSRSTFASVTVVGGSGTSIVFGPDGNLYWAITARWNGSNYNLTGYVYKITPQGDMTTLASAPTQGSMATSLAVDSDNNIYWAVSNNYSGGYGLTSYVYKVDQSGTITTFARETTQGAYGTALRWDSSGNLCWAINNSYNGSSFSLTSYLYRLTKSTKYLFLSAPTSSAYGTALAFDSAGNLCWAISNFRDSSTYDKTSYMYRTITPYQGGYGGGAGGCAIKFITSPASSYDYVVGAGGSSNANGGDTIIAGMVAYGGSTNLGGNATGGDLNIRGGSAGGVRTLVDGGEAGGKSFFGCGGSGGVDSSVNGDDGSFGGGGGGCGRDATVGGNGGAGVIEIQEYVKVGGSGGTDLRNIVINGEMKVAQRGTSFAVGQNSSAYTLDRWVQENNHDAGNIVVSQDSLVVPDANTACSIKITNANGNDGNVGADQYAVISQRIEGYNIRKSVGGSLALSFWVRSSKAGIYCVSLRNGSNDRSYVHEFAIDETNTWEKKTATFPMDYSGGNWNYDSGIGLILTFCLAGGTSYQTTKGAWQNGNYFCTANQTNWLNETNNSFYLTNVQLENGALITPLEQRAFSDELVLCQRYYQLLGGSQNNLRHIVKSSSTGEQFGISYVLPVEMRDTPTATKVGTWTTFNCDQPTVEAVSPTSVRVYSTSVDGHSYYGWECNSADDAIVLDAEL